MKNTRNPVIISAEEYKRLKAAEKKQNSIIVRRIGSTQLKCCCGAVIRLYRYCPYCGQSLQWKKEGEADL